MKMRPILRLLTGAAGTGKSSRCIELFRDRILASGSSGLSDPSYYVLPNKEHTDRIHDLLTRDERVTGLVQHHLLPIGDFMRFKCWSGRDRVVSQFERRWLVRQALDSRPWSWMAASAATPGMAERMTNFLREWKGSGASGRSFGGEAERLVRAGTDPAKAADLAEFCDAYERIKRANGFRDPEEMVDAFAEESRAVGEPDLGLVILDGFFSLTELQLRFVEAVAARSKEMWVTLTLPGPDGRRGAFPYPMRLRDRLLGMGFEEVRPDPPGSRFRSAGLAALERTLFDPRSMADAQGSAGVRRIEAATRRQEIEAIAREMTSHVRSGRCHWSDQMVVCRGIRAYQPYVEEVFGALDIPYELHERRRLSDHPAVRRLAEWMELIEAPEASDPGPVPEDGTGPEVRVRVHRWALWMNAGRAMAELEALPARLAWSQIPERFVQMDASAQALWRREYARMRDFLGLQDASGFKRFLEGMLEDCCGACVLPATVRVKELVRELIERQTVRPVPDGAAARAAAARLRADLDAALYSTGTRRKNRVQVYDTSLAMLKEYRIVYVAGLNHGEFPAAHHEDVLLHDRERVSLRELGVHLDTAEERRGGEAFFFYMAATRASEALVLTRHSTDDQGRPTAVSPWWTEAGRIFGPDLETRKIGPSDLVPAPREVRNPRDLLKALGEEVRREADAADISGEVCAAWDRSSPELWTAAGWPMPAGSVRERARRLRNPAEADLSALDPSGTARRKPWSATEAQALLQCRYKYFVQYGLGIRPQVETTPVMREGELWHKALELLMRRWSGKGLPRRDVFLKDAAAALEEAMREHPLLPERFYMKEARSGRIRRRWPRIAEAEWENWKASSGIVPAHFEAAFGLVRDGRRSEKGPFKIRVGGEALEFQGQIDRIDADPANRRALAADYKSGKGFDRKDLENGMLFQSVLYTLALREVWGYEPIGTEYVSLKTFKRAGLLREDLYREARPATRLKSLMTREAFDTFIDRSLETLAGTWKLYRAGDIAADARSCRNCDYYPLCRYEKRRSNP